MRHFTPEEDKFILENYKVISMAEIARLLCRHKTSTRQRLHLLGYEVPKQIGQHFAKRSQMQPGHISHNKGKAMPPEIREKVSHTWFPKGHRPHNTKPADGVITIRTDKKTGRQYQYIREGLSRWEPLHRHLWRQHHGKIPRGKVVVFKDGNPMNCVIDNLELLTYQENMMRNTIQNLPTELRNAKLMIGGFNRKLNKYAKENHQ
jgi:hypothetical protein